MQLNGKTVVLTGATGGIGRCIAQALASAGARLLLIGRDGAALEALSGALPVSSQAHMHLVADLRQPQERESIAALCAEVQVDILINNAGAGKFALLEHSESDAIAALIDLNLTAPIQLTRLLLPLLKSRPEAAVINIGSALGSIGYPGYSVYSASKFGLRGFSEALRREVSDSHVRVLHLAPRATRTALNSDHVVAMNTAMGVAMDTPESVASVLLSHIARDRWTTRVIGWPERFYAWINAVLPGMTDSSIKKQLGQIKQFALLGRHSDSPSPQAHRPTGENG